jgi:hypothetical protein
LSWGGPELRLRSGMVVKINERAEASLPAGWQAPPARKADTFGHSVNGGAAFGTGFRVLDVIGAFDALMTITELGGRLGCGRR